MIPNVTPITMSSFEISRLTGKRHDRVMRDIRTMLSELELDKPDSPNFGAMYLERPDMACRSICE